MNHNSYSVNKIFIKKMNGDLSSTVNTEKDFLFKITEIKSFAYLSIKKLFNINFYKLK